MNRVLAGTAASINRCFGAGTIWQGGDHPEQGRFSTGFESLDAATGGIPKGRIVEVFGAESSGKSALALHLARQAGEVLYMDADNALSDGRGLYIMTPETLEDALGAVEIAAQAVDSIVIDTLTALPTRAEAEARLGNFHARPGSTEVLTHALPRLIPKLLKHNCTLFLVTQLRNVPGIMYGRPDRPNGGYALRNYAALRIETRRVEHIKQGPEVVGQGTIVDVQKNKFGAPHRRTEMVLMYGQGWRAAG